MANPRRASTEAYSQEGIEEEFPDIFIEHRQPDNTAEVAELTGEITKLLRPLVFTEAEDMKHYIANKLDEELVRDIAIRVGLKNTTLHYHLKTIAKKINEALEPLHQAIVIDGSPEDIKTFALALHAALKKIQAEGQAAEPKLLGR